MINGTKLKLSNQVKKKNEKRPIGHAICFQRKPILSFRGGQHLRYDETKPSSTNETRDNFAIFFGEGLRCGDKVNTSAVGRQKKSSTAVRKLKTRYQRLENLCERRLSRLFFDVIIFNTSVFLKR